MYPMKDNALIDDEREGKICGLSCMMIIGVTIMIWSITTIDMARSLNREIELELFTEYETLWNTSYRS
jgi:hypothetical protein